MEGREGVGRDGWRLAGWWLGLSALSRRRLFQPASRRPPRAPVGCLAGLVAAWRRPLFPASSASCPSSSTTSFSVFLSAPKACSARAPPSPRSLAPSAASPPPPPGVRRRSSVLFPVPQSWLACSSRLGYNDRRPVRPCPLLCLQFGRGIVRLDRWTFDRRRSAPSLTDSARRRDIERTKPAGRYGSRRSHQTDTPRFPCSSPPVASVSRPSVLLPSARSHSIVSSRSRLARAAAPLPSMAGVGLYPVLVNWPPLFFKTLTSLRFFSAARRAYAGAYERTKPHFNIGTIGVSPSRP